MRSYVCCVGSRWTSRQLHARPKIRKPCYWSNTFVRFDVCNRGFVVKSRQFRQLAGLSPERMAEHLIDGLNHIANHVRALAEDLDACSNAGARWAVRLVENQVREEAGKFLLLMDIARNSAIDSRELSDHLARAGRHLPKLLYAQMADYAIASRAEMDSAIDRHRRSLYLDGPNDIDWIFRNDLIEERENPMYVDLIEAEGGELVWWLPRDHDASGVVPLSVRLVLAVQDLGLVSPEGFAALGGAWAGFDATADSHAVDWMRRTKEAVAHLPLAIADVDGRLTEKALLVVERWPMPLIGFDLDFAEVTIQELQAERERLLDLAVGDEYGFE